MVENNISKPIQDESILNLITGLTTVMWVTSLLSNDEQYSSIVNVLEMALAMLLPTSEIFSLACMKRRSRQNSMH